MACSGRADTNSLKFNRLCAPLMPGVRLSRISLKDKHKGARLSLPCYRVAFSSRRRASRLSFIGSYERLAASGEVVCGKYVMSQSRSRTSHWSGRANRESFIFNRQCAPLNSSVMLLLSKVMA